MSIETETKNQQQTYQHHFQSNVNKKRFHFLGLFQHLAQPLLCFEIVNGIKFEIDNKINKPQQQKNSNIQSISIPGRSTNIEWKECHGTFNLITYYIFFFCKNEWFYTFKKNEIKNENMFFGLTMNAIAYLSTKRERHKS